MSPSLEPKLNGGENVLRILDGLPQGFRAIALVRHAERSKAPAGHAGDFDGSGLRLTPEGHAAARHFGRSLPRGRSLNVHHSPLQRAAETASDIVGGFREVGRDSPPKVGGVETLLLPFHGSIVDNARFQQLRRDLGTGHRLMVKWMDGETPPGVLRSASEARTRRLDMLQRGLLNAPSDSMRLFISHDFTIILLRDWLFGLRFEECPWPAYLDGIVISEDGGGGLTARWRDRTVPIRPG